MEKQLRAFEYWPENSAWSHNFWRGIGTAFSGGGDLAECHLAASQMRLGNIEDWYKCWLQLANRVEQLGNEAMAGGHVISARNCYLRACNYYRSAEFFLSPKSPNKLKTYVKARDCFQKAREYLYPKVEEVEIPYEGTALYGYLCHPLSKKPGPNKTLVFFGGADSVAEEVYLAFGKVAAERGYACLIVDGPGQGASLRFRKILSRYDYEVPVTATIDYLKTRVEVDMDSIALVSWSLGGYYAVRAAAFEKRVKACVVWGACFDVLSLGRPGSEGEKAKEQVAWFTGSKDIDQARAILEKWTLQGIADKVDCPLFILHGEDDPIVPVEHAYKTYEAAKGDKTLLVIKSGEPGSLHCQTDSMVTAHYHIFNWLDDKLK